MAGEEKCKYTNISYFLFCVPVSVCVSARAVCFLFQKCAWMFVLPMKINAHQFSIKYEVNL